MVVTTQHLANKLPECMMIVKEVSRQVQMMKTPIVTVVLRLMYQAKSVAVATSLVVNRMLKAPHSTTPRPLVMVSGTIVTGIRTPLLVDI